MTFHDRSWLSAYLDDEHTGDTLRKARAHLASCPTCAAELQEMRRLRRVLRQGLAHVPAGSSADFVDGVVARLPDRVVPGRSQVRLWWVVPLLIVVASTFAQAVLAVAQVLLAAARWEAARGPIEALRRLLPPQGSGLRLPDLVADGLQSAWWFDSIGSVAFGLVLNLVGLVALGLIVWSWLAGWHAFERHAQLHRSPFRTEGG